MHDTLVAVVVLVGEQHLPALSKTRGIHGIPVVLARDVAPVRANV